MKRLILLRHAKSAWDDPTVEDHDRPLNARGRRAAPVIGGWLAERGFVPAAIICSTAARARETWSLVAPSFAAAPDASIKPSLYHADPATMLALVRAAPNDADALMLIGHQPGLSGFARKLSKDPVAPGCARAFQHYPTGAAAVIDFDAARWDQVAWGEGRFHAFAAPRELV
jgi:phosphohistidine phosphatase